MLRPRAYSMLRKLNYKMSENFIYHSDSDIAKDSEESPKRKVRQKIIYNEIEPSSEKIDPQFVVTLNGIDHNKYLKNSECKHRSFGNLSNVMLIQSWR